MAQAGKTAVEERKHQILAQLSRLKYQLISKTRSHYKTEHSYRSAQKRTSELITELESELSILESPGEYDELPTAVIAEELDLTINQVRSLIKLGEIRASGKLAHERISRDELERLCTLGVAELIRRSEESAADIFEQSIPYLQEGELEAANIAYQRLEARESWSGPHAPAFLVALELARGEIEHALFTLKCINTYPDILHRLAIRSCLGRILRTIRYEEPAARELCKQTLRYIETGKLHSDDHDILSKLKNYK
jgi:hypothetical protein